MKRNLTTTQQKLGQSPGEMIYTGVAQKASIKITQRLYNNDGVSEEDKSQLQKLKSKKDQKNWIHVEGVHDINVLKKIGDQFEIHNLFLEDVANVDKRSSTEFMEPYLFVTIKYLTFNSYQVLKSHSVNIIVDEDKLISFCESGQSDWIKPVIKRLQGSKNPIRTRSTYYLLYALMDVLVDQFFVVLEEVEAQVEAMERIITQNPSKDHLDKLYQLKKELLDFRKQTIIIPELIRVIEDEIDETQWNPVQIYFKDLLDHALHVQETTKNNIDILSGMFDLYFSLINLKMNQTIHVLTIITVVFLPLSLLTGIYGMNFISMPGIQNEQGFWILVGVMGLIVISILCWFKQQKWF